MSSVQTTLISACVFIFCLFFVLVFIFIGWYLVWRFFLQRFGFIRELYANENTNSEDAAKRKREKSRKD